MSVAAGGIGAVVRVARVRAREGARAALADAARANTADALGAGALSAEVCAEPDDPDAFVVISRWSSAADLEEFLGWHEQHAHESMADHSEGRPEVVHHPVLSAAARGTGVPS